MDSKASRPDTYCSMSTFFITTVRRGPKVVVPRTVHRVKPTDTFADLYEQCQSSADWSVVPVRSLDAVSCVWSSPTELFKTSDSSSSCHMHIIFHHVCCVLPSR